MADRKDGTKEFVLKPGHVHHGFKDGERHQYVGGEKGNDRVYLNENQAKAFSDKFESLEEQKERVKLQEQLSDLQTQKAELDAALAEKGVTLEELLATIKKPDPSPSVGTAEPAPTKTTPAPTGSTSDPVNAAPASPTESAKPQAAASTTAKPAGSK